MTSAISLRLALLALVGLSNSARALDLPITGGRSPNGRYEMRVSGNHKDSQGYWFTLFDRKRGKEVWAAPEVVGGFCYLKGASTVDTALWHPDGSFVAVTDHGTRHSMELYVFALASGHLRPVKVPEGVPFQMKDGTDGNDIKTAGDVWEPLRWSGDALIARVIAQLNYQWYACEATLKLERHRHSTPTMRLVKVTKAEEWSE